jgi:N-hydroxyarylamine O-acetyltransferase
MLLLVTQAAVSEYLHRLAYAGPRDPTLATLRKLHVAHLRAVPFENLSVRRGEAIHLEEAWLFDKVVNRRRGGFCYELNGLFALLLEALGFRAARLAGRVGIDGIPFDHMALRVDLEEPWLADVGFGDSFSLPLHLASRDVQDGGDGRSYRLEDVEDGVLLAREGERGFERQYVFTLEPWPLAAFGEGCRYHCTSTRSTFTQRTIVSRATGSGRVTLSEQRLIVTEGGRRTETELAGNEAVARALEQRFGIAAPLPDSKSEGDTSFRSP